MSNPALVISAFNRPEALRRLLKSLGQAVYPAGGVRLVISIDAPASAADEAHRRAVVAVAEQAEWPFGPKTIIAHADPLGPVGNVFFCGGQSRAHGDIIFLEDDFIVSPAFYAYAAGALDFYRRDERVACLSLYALWFNGYTHEPFVPLPEASDVFFAQVPFFQGLAFTAEQWARFDAWRAGGRPQADDPLHDLFRHFPEDDYYPILAKYVATAGKFVVYPRVGLCLGMGDPGTHFSRPTAFFQTPLQSAPADYRFRALDDACAVYDAFFELLPERLNRLAPALRGLSYDIDLYAAKAPRHLQSEFVVTSRPCRAARQTYGRVLWPHEMNVVQALPGSGLAVCQTADLRWGRWADVEARWRGHLYFTRGRRMRLAFLFLELLRRLRA